MDNRLDRLIIAAPCPIEWEDMLGDDRMRKCNGCSRNVYNVSDMTDREAEEFLKVNGANECVRLFRRDDGKIMTDNCPRGLRTIRDKVKFCAQIAASFVASIVALAPVGRQHAAQGQEARQANDIKGDVMVLPTITTPQPRALRGEAVIVPVIPAHGTGKQHKQIMINGEVCPDKSKGSAESPKTTQAAVATAQPDLKDSRAYKLYLSAKQSESAGKLLLAQTQYQQALKIANEQSIKPDPKMVQLITSSLEAVKLRIGVPLTPASSKEGIKPVSIERE